MWAESYKEILNGGSSREVFCCANKLVVVERLLLRKGGQRRQNRLITARFALCWLSLRRPIAISNYLATAEAWKSKTCNLQRIFQKKDNSAAVGFLFYLKKKKRNQLSRKSNERGGVSFWRIFFCKGTMNIKGILLAGTYIYDFFVCSNLIDLHTQWLRIFLPFVYDLEKHILTCLARLVVCVSPNYLPLVDREHQTCGGAYHPPSPNQLGIVIAKTDTYTIHIDKQK